MSQSFPREVKVTMIVQHLLQCLSIVSHFLRQYRDSGPVLESRRALPRRRSRQIGVETLELLESRVVPAGVQLTSLGSLQTTEAGGQAEFSVVLTSPPTKNVTIPIATSNRFEGASNVRQLVFTSANWSTPQLFTVRGVDDAVTDGDRAYQLVLGKFKSGDKSYKALAHVTQSLTNVDNDIPGLVVNSGSNLVTTEAGGRASFTVKLATKPTSNVVVPLRTSPSAEGTVTASLVFTTKNWSKAQTVTITGLNDSMIDGNQTYQVLFDPAQSSDVAYQGKTSASIQITNMDDDVAGVSISPRTGLTVNEGATKNIAFKLTAQPTADVTVTLTPSGGIGQATLSQSILIFTSANWSTPQNVVLLGALGDGADGDMTFSVDVDTTSDDPNFNELQIPALTATIRNTEIQAAVNVTPRTGVFIAEGASRNLGFKLSTAPTGDVIVTLTPTNGLDQATLSVTELTFTPSNWNITQNVTVQATSGDGVDGIQAFEFDIDTVSSDAQFNVLSTESVTATILDTEGPAPTFDGVYAGSYSGTVSTFGLSQSVSGAIAATVVGNTFSLTQPISLTRTLPTDGAISFFIPVSAAAFSGVSFSGDSVHNPDGSVTISGSWTITKLGVHGSGTWSLRRGPLS